MNIELVKHKLINWITDLEDEDLLMKVDLLRKKIPESGTNYLKKTEMPLKKVFCN